MARVGIGEEVRLLLACFYADNGLIALRDPNFLQQAFDLLPGLFDRVGLQTNKTLFVSTNLEREHRGLLRHRPAQAHLEAY